MQLDIGIVSLGVQPIPANAEHAGHEKEAGEEAWHCQCRQKAECSEKRLKSVLDAEPHQAPPGFKNEGNDCG